MSLSYVLRLKKNYIEKEEPGKYYLTTKSHGHIDLEKLLEEACQDTTLDKDEMRLGVNLLFRKITNELLYGFTVRLGTLGHIELSIRSKGAENPKEANSKLAVNIVVNYRIYPQAIYRQQ